MEDFALDVMIGKGPSARSLRLSLKPFTIVGATTRAGRISSPLRDRFGATYRLDFYDQADLHGDRRAVGAAPRRGAEPGRRLGHRPPRPGHAPRREPPPAPRPRLRPDPRRRARGRRNRGQGPGRARDRRRGPGRDGPQAPGRDRPEVRRRARRGAGPGGRAGRGGGDGRGRVRAVPAAPRLPRSHAAGPHRHGRRPPAPRPDSVSRFRRSAGPSRISPRSGKAPPARARTARAVDGDDSRRAGSRARLAGPLRGARAAAARRLDEGAPRPPDAAPRRRGDAPVHAGRHERHGQGPRSGGPSRGRRHDHPARTRTTSTCAPATSASRPWAACTGSWPGTGRS